MKTHASIKTLMLAAIAMGIVALLFFDVIFLKASLQPSNISPQIGAPDQWAAYSLFPRNNINATTVYGHSDLGASQWQSEPAHYLMARNFREHESPYWNPYSASGTVGPETLVDIKFSPFSVISAWFFNASPESFDFGLMIIYLIGSFLVLVILNKHLHLNLASSVMGAVVYLLNGFSVPNLISHMGQPYFFFPVLLYPLILFYEKQSALRWISVVAAHALLFSITFLPTLLLVLFSVHFLAFFVFIPKEKLILSSIKQMGLIFLAAGTGLLLIGFLWFPIIDSFFVTDLMTKFQDRSIQSTFGIENLLSVFTPKHFWEVNAPIVHSTLYPNAHLENNELSIVYLGIFPAIVASYAISREIRETKKIVFAALALLLFSYARIFGLTGFIDHVPLVTSIGIQYWGVLTAIAFIFLVSQGFENIKTGTISHIPALVIIALTISGFLILYHKLGFTDISPYRIYLKIALYQIIIGIIVITLLKKSKISTQDFCIVMTALMIFELMSYMNTLRPLRYDPVEKQPAFVHFLKNNIEDSRVINIGGYRTLYPEYGAMYGIKQIDTQNPAQLPWYRDFYTRHFGSDTWMFLTLGTAAEMGNVILADKIISETALDIANVKYILVEDTAKPYLHFFQQHNYPVVFQKDGLVIFENVNHLAEATLLPSILQLDSIPETPDFNPGLSATTNDSTLITQATQLGIPVLSKPDALLKLIPTVPVITSFHNTEITLETTSSQAAILTFSEVWHPNWKASVDGNPIYVGRINEAFRGIALPAGDHKIRMYYESTALRYGIYSSVATLLILLFVFIYSFIKERFLR